MNIELRIFLIIGVIAYMSGIIFLISRKRLSLKYSLLWMFSALILFVLAVFPQIAVWVSHLVGIQTPVNAVFLFFLFCIIILLISLSSIVTKQSNDIKRLIQHLAILEKELNEYKNNK